MFDYIQLKETKTDKHNMVAITKGVKKAIRDHMKVNFNGNLDQYLFQSRKGDNKPINRHAAWMIINDLAIQVGLKNIGITQDMKDRAVLALDL